MAAAQAGQTRADEIAAAPITRTLGPTVTLLLFALGLVVGVAVQSYISPPPPATPYAELSLVNEPPEAAALVRLIVADDARGISAVMEGEVLQALGARQVVDAEPPRVCRRLIGLSQASILAGSSRAA